MVQPLGAAHWPPEHVSPAPHVPQEPPQPSPPQAWPAQDGVQVLPPPLQGLACTWARRAPAALAPKYEYAAISSHDVPSVRVSLSVQPVHAVPTWHCVALLIASSQALELMTARQESQVMLVKNSKAQSRSAAV